MTNKSGFRLGLLSGIISVFLLLSSLGTSCLVGPGANGPRPVNLATDLDEIDSRMRATVAFVDPETERIFCSGFFVSGRQIISAAHCFEATVPFAMPNGDVIQLPSGISPQGEVVHFITYDDLDMVTNHFVSPPQEATIVYHSGQDDLVILELNLPARDSQFTFSFAEIRPRVGSQAYGIGHPYRLAWSFESGIISRVVQNPSNGRIILLQASVPVAGGNSGGPLLDSEGNLIGMALAFVDRLPHLSIFISAEQIRAQMRMHWAQQLIMAYEQRTNEEAQNQSESHE